MVAGDTTPRNLAAERPQMELLLSAEASGK